MSTEKTQGTGVPILDGNKEVNLRRLEYSPQENPFMVG